jgi:hypothetical protein
VLFEIISDMGNGNNPTTGQMILAENNDPNVIPNFYESYLNINIGAGTQDYFGVHTPGSNFINFETLSIPNLELSNISIFPNPAKDLVQIRGLENELTKIDIFNINGQHVINYKGNNDFIDISNLDEGVYFIKLYTNNASKTLKLVVKH